VTVQPDETRRLAADLPPLLLGCDFTSRPTPRKPVVIAWGQFDGKKCQYPSKNGALSLLKIQQLDSFPAVAGALQAPSAAWLGGFDLPFGLPRELVEALGWPTEWRGCMDHYASLSRAAIRDTFAAFCAARPAGGKFAHRATDGPAGSSPSMKWVNPPVAYMLHAGVPLLRAAGCHFPGLSAGRRDRVALEAYPGLLARQALAAAAGEAAARRSYKADDRARQTPERLIARRAILTALEAGTVPLLQAAGLRLRLSHAQRDALADDASGDTLDAVLCLLLAACAAVRHACGDNPPGGPGWGLPPFDSLEGWITGC
jgi:hypothetical protein